MTDLVINHAVLCYLLVSAVFGAWLVARITPEQFRIRAEHYSRAADEIEEFERQAITPFFWNATKFICGFFWVVFIPVIVWRTTYRIIWGAERKDCKG